MNVLAVIDAEMGFVTDGIARGDQLMSLDMSRVERVEVARIRTELSTRMHNLIATRTAVATLIAASRCAVNLDRVTHGLREALAAVELAP